MKKLAALMLALVLALSLIACGNTAEESHTEPAEESEVAADTESSENDIDGYSTIDVDLIGDENIDEIQSVVFGYIKDNTRYGVGIVSEDDDIRSIELPPGHYYAFTKEIGRYEFDIDEADKTYSLKVDYDNNNMVFF